MTYPYVARNILVEPQTYMYAPFGGHALLDEYHASRIPMLGCGIRGVPPSADSALFRLAQPLLESWLAERGDLLLAAWQSRVPPGKGTSDAHGGIRLKSKADILPVFAPDAMVVTSDLIRAIVCSQLSGLHDKQWQGWSCRLVQRFEVAKRIYEKYPPGFRKGAGDFQSLSRYLLFALSLCLHHASTGSLVALNALLKVGDLICSVGSDELDREVAEADLRLVLATELAMVHDLAAGKGVPIAA